MPLSQIKKGIDILFADGTIKTKIPETNENQQLVNLITAYQVHSMVHSNSKPCWKYKNSTLVLNGLPGRQNLTLSKNILTRN